MNEDNSGSHIDLRVPQKSRKMDQFYGLPIREGKKNHQETREGRQLYDEKVTNLHSALLTDGFLTAREAEERQQLSERKGEKTRTRALIAFVFEGHLAGLPISSAPKVAIQNQTDACRVAPAFGDANIRASLNGASFVMLPMTYLVGVMAGRSSAFFHRVSATDEDLIAVWIHFFFQGSISVIRSNSNEVTVSQSRVQCLPFRACAIMSPYLHLSIHRTSPVTSRPHPHPPHQPPSHRALYPSPHFPLPPIPSRHRILTSSLHSPQPQTHVLHHRRVSNIARVRVAVQVGDPFALGGVGVAGAYVAHLEGFEVLLRSEFVCLWSGGYGISSGRVCHWDGKGSAPSARLWGLLEQRREGKL